MLSKTETRNNLLHDITHWGISASIGAIFIVHSIKKFDPSWQEWLISIGLPPEMQLPIALAEFLGGIFLVAGIFTRISAIIFSVILLGAIFHIRWKKDFLFHKVDGNGSCYACCSIIHNCCRTRKSIYC